MKLLLDEGADIEQRNVVSLGTSCKLISLSTLSTATSARTVLRRNAHLQMLETPLIRCAHNGHYESVQFLVEHGADVNSIDLVSHNLIHAHAFFSISEQKERALKAAFAFLHACTSLPSTRLAMGREQGCDQK